MQTMFGYAQKILRIDLTTEKITDQKIPISLVREYIGGRGLAAKLFYDEVLPSVPPLSSDNRLIFTVGPFVGTTVPNSSRYSVTAKSPLTNLWASSDCGGTWGQGLKSVGLEGIIFTGRAKKPIYVWISDRNVELRRADHVWGEDAYETDSIVREETDSQAIVACIGPAGERLVKFASICSNGKHARVAGRAGLGAVMGSKNLKAIAVRGAKSTAVADEDLLKRAVKEVLPNIVGKTRGLGIHGTINLVESSEVSGDLPIKNWLKGRWKEGAERITGEVMTKSILAGRYYCGKCVIGCGRVVKISEGKFAGIDGAGPEYETAAALGSLCIR
jgi:aldehyde:ferredoxin oxidoreductase